MGSGLWGEEDGQGEDRALGIDLSPIIVSPHSNRWHVFEACLFLNGMYIINP